MESQLWNAPDWRRKYIGVVPKASRDGEVCVEGGREREEERERGSERERDTEREKVKEKSEEEEEGEVESSIN